MVLCPVHGIPGSVGHLLPCCISLMWADRGVALFVKMLCSGPETQGAAHGSSDCKLDLPIWLRFGPKMPKGFETFVVPKWLKIDSKEAKNTV